MLKTWISILFRPSEQVFAAEREKAYATLAVAVGMIVFVNMAVTFAELGQGKLADLWVIRPDEINTDATLPEFVMRFGYPVVNLRVWLVSLSFEIADLYARMWLLSDILLDIGFAYFYPVVLFVTDEGRRWLFDIRKIFLNPVYFVFSMGVYHYLARALGGQGQFGRYAFLFAMYQVPLALLISLLDFGPLLGPMVVVSYAAAFGGATSLWGHLWHSLVEFPVIYMVSWLLSFYGVGLAYFATRAEHGIVWWRAVVVAVVGYVMAFVIRNSPLYLFMGLMEAMRMLRGG